MRWWLEEKVERGVLRVSTGNVSKRDLDEKVEAVKRSMESCCSFAHPALERSHERIQNSPARASRATTLKKTLQRGVCWLAERARQGVAVKSRSVLHRIDMIKSTNDSVRSFGVAPGELVVVALGGNALLKRGERMSEETQLINARSAAQNVANLVEAGYRVVLTHGNGPQVGQLAVQAPDTALHMLDAQTEGAIGYILQREIYNALKEQGNAAHGEDTHEVVAIVTQTLVSAVDPAFENPTKPIGRLLTQEQAEEFAASGVSVAEDAVGGAWRRVVASPRPLEIIEQSVIARLVDANVLVVCCGGGGIPVIKDSVSGMLRGVDAVVDKDAASSLLAHTLNARALLLLTDAAGVIPAGLWAGDPYDRNLVTPVLSLSQSENDVCDHGVGRVEDADRVVSCTAVDAYAAGSMRPKVQAALDFAAKQPSGAPPRFAAIGQLERALDVLQARDGTRVIAGDVGTASIAQTRHGRSSPVQVNQAV
mmetsp:Transcript_1873/g.4102  ORF Transcript_1873/g.4102 Transcript_1873/m.4102 type:complete len:481 (-) Transcript_1873:683-2125(-)